MSTATESSGSAAKAKADHATAAEALTSMDPMPKPPAPAAPSKQKAPNNDQTAAILALGQLTSRPQQGEQKMLVDTHGRMLQKCAGAFLVRGSKIRSFRSR